MEGLPKSMTYIYYIYKYKGSIEFFFKIQKREKSEIDRSDESRTEDPWPGGGGGVRKNRKKVHI